MRPASTFVLLVLSLGACGGEADVDGEPAIVLAPPPTIEELEPEPGDAERITGPDGALLASEEIAWGLVLPRGLTGTIEEERRHVYMTLSSPAAVVDYLGPRLTTSEVTRTDHGSVTYLHATPVGATDGPAMDVTIAPSSGMYTTRVEIVLEPAEVLGEPSEEEARRRLEHLLESGE